MDIYAQNILDRYKEPLYKGKAQDAAITRKEANHSCGDEVECRLDVKGGNVTAYGFEGVGCAISMASADMLGDLVIGMPLSKALALTKKDIYEVLGIEVSLRRSKCALLGLLALQNAILLEQKKNKRSWIDYHI